MHNLWSFFELTDFVGSICTAFISIIIFIDGYESKETKAWKKWKKENGLENVSDFAIDMYNQQIDIKLALRNRNQVTENKAENDSV